MPIFVVPHKSMYLYKLKIELDNDGKKASYSKFVFVKWITLIFNIISIVCIMVHLEGIVLCTDLLIILISVKIIRLIFRLGINKFRIFMIKSTLDNIIEESEEDGIIKIDFKNICKYELEINKDSLGNRFVKGDKSRNSDGYGLGLRIVKNLIRVQGGKFKIITEGDLFKVSIVLKNN